MYTCRHNNGRFGIEYDANGKESMSLPKGMSRYKNNMSFDKSIKHVIIECEICENGKGKYYVLNEIT